MLPEVSCHQLVKHDLFVKRTSADLCVTDRLCEKPKEIVSEESSPRR